jgi:hypothetical protein
VRAAWRPRERGVRCAVWVAVMCVGRRAGSTTVRARVASACCRLEFAWCAVRARAVGVWCVGCVWRVLTEGVEEAERSRSGQSLGIVRATHGAGRLHRRGRRARHGHWREAGGGRDDGEHGVCWKELGWLVVGAGITKSAKEPKRRRRNFSLSFYTRRFRKKMSSLSGRPGRSLRAWSTWSTISLHVPSRSLTSQGTVRRVCTAGIYVEPRVTVGFSSASHELREALLQQLGGLSMQCTRRRQHFASTWVLREPHTLTNER